MCAVAGALAVPAALLPAGSGPPQPRESTTASGPARAWTNGSGPTLPRSAPTGLDIPAIGVHARDIVRLGRTADGRIQVPQKWGAVGWYSAGPWPGQFGTAVMVGHVDSQEGPAVFFRLGELRPGAAVAVPRADGTVATFMVYAVKRYPKQQFPTRTVYAPSSRAELRLITCGGSFDDGADSYRDNIVVYAAMAR